MSPSRILERSSSVHRGSKPSFGFARCILDSPKSAFVKNSLIGLRALSHDPKFSIGIIAQRPRVSQRAVEPKEIQQTPVVPPAYHFLSHVMTSLSNTVGHSRQSKVRGGEPNIDEIHDIARALGTLNQRQVAPARQRGFEGEAFAVSQKVMNPLDHETPSLDRRRFRSERREALRDVVCIDELRNAKCFWKQNRRSR